MLELTGGDKASGSGEAGPSHRPRAATFTNRLKVREWSAFDTVRVWVCCGRRLLGGVVKLDAGAKGCGIFFAGGSGGSEEKGPRNSSKPSKMPLVAVGAVVGVWPIEEDGFITKALWVNDKEVGGADCAGDDRNSEKSSSSSRFITGEESAVCEGVCERDRGGGERGEIMPVGSGPNESLPTSCFWKEKPWESIGKAVLGLSLGTGGGVEW